MGTYTLLYLKRTISEDLVCSTWDSAQGHVTAWMGGGIEEEWIPVYEWLSPFALRPKLPQHC